ncbi:ATP-dependent DNA helicase PIF1 [Brachionus plicatilis]|uniref:ATP-dependent DNA helicase PIF1 n=1 Tax=Brachionus plicatilis TaxID=10195 RepID=A0A3M7S7F3_BRAPC|nr:ATP-dependent DNA helicase PIF1 [Brachionus plicatilis]
MPLDNLSKRFCPILEGCRRRGDIIGKKVQVGDIMCRKHYMRYYDRKDNKNVTNTINSIDQNSRTDDKNENTLDQNNYEAQPTTSTNIDRPIEVQNSIHDFDFGNEETVTQNVFPNKNKKVLEIKRGYASHSLCFICERKTGSKGMSVLSLEPTIDIYMKRDIFISRGARLCREHLTENYYVKVDHIFSIPVVSDNIGLTNEKILEIFEVRNAMIKDFVPNYLGAKRFSREQWLGQNTEMVKALFDLDDNQLAIIADESRKDIDPIFEPEKNNTIEELQLIENDWITKQKVFSDEIDNEEELPDVNSNNLNTKQRSCYDMGITDVIIGEYSMLTQAMFGLIDNRLRQATGKLEELFGDLYIILTVYLDQLLPVGGSPLYHYPQTTQLSSQGYYCYLQFEKAVCLETIVRQQNLNNDHDQERFI